ncbi:MULTISPECIES: nuclear transport factor 2 family protein [unclassified Nodularia (in: cyanobacteria)]|uniref:nuclear transport factor 2 family protein n=1 Tax=unclassified Nodularia (in: cyanobacteria) TaxID=2656917 RepID=UPI0018825014|nr:MULTISPECIES: nuclear transport factor 2 family protein [unclassified Nodularia (in: cyanobacteria)]MBE9198968.1 nuclear transport factor 2 family protein [Nodularia sp. LEGE 06071]MCC2695592.1 nuclear transport factor 2 family protein [Nodularia sp. LEGE 04288]
MKTKKANSRIFPQLISILWHRVTLIALAITFVLLIGGRFEPANASQPNAQLELQKLTTCYALGTDAIGSGNVFEGKNIYRDCFTQGAVITAVFPDGATETLIGTDAWADFVASVFQNNGYQATQHLIGTINISVQGNQGNMSSYLHATHKRSDTSIDVANGTYEDEVVKVNGRWKIQRRTLKLITFLNLSSPPNTTTNLRIPHQR